MRLNKRSQSQLKTLIFYLEVHIASQSLKYHDDCCYNPGKGSLECLKDFFDN